MTRRHGGSSTASTIHACVHHRHVVLLDVVEGSWVDRIPATSLVVNVVENLSRELNIIIRELANLSVIDTQDLGILGRAKTEARNQVHDEED